VVILARTCWTTLAAFFVAVAAGWVYNHRMMPLEVLGDSHESLERVVHEQAAAKHITTQSNCSICFSLPIVFDSSVNGAVTD